MMFYPKSWTKAYNLKNANCISHEISSKEIEITWSNGKVEKIAFDKPPTARRNFLLMVKHNG